MTTFEICKAIRAKIEGYTGILMNAPYGSFSKYFDASILIEVINNTYNFDENPLDITELSDDEMDRLGFYVDRFDDDLYLVPLYLFPFLPEFVLGQNVNIAYGEGMKPINTKNNTASLTLPVAGTACTRLGVYSKAALIRQAIRS